MRAGALELNWRGERGQSLARHPRDQRRTTCGARTCRREERQVVRPGARPHPRNIRSPPAAAASPPSRRCPCAQLGMFTPEVIERQKWFAFWDAPLNVPGRPGIQCRRGPAAQAGRDPARLGHVSDHRLPGEDRWRAPGSHLPRRHRSDLFAGGLRYTVYRGTNLIRQEVVAKTDAPSVAYKFAAGLKGFAIAQRHAPGVARHRARLAALPVRRRA